MRLDLNGVRLGYQLDGEGPPIVLLHGFPLNREMWRPQVAALRDRFTLLVPDLRGFGESGLPDGPLTMDAYAHDVLRLIDALGYDQVTLGGCSMGGYVAFRVVAQARDRIASLLIVDSRAEPDTDEGRQRRQASIARIDREGPAGFLQEFAAQLVGPTTRAQRPGVLDAVRQIIGAPPAPSLKAALAAMAARPDSRSLLPEIRVPALVVVGEEDTLTPPAVAEAMVRALPHGRLVAIPAAGHLSNLEAPEAVNRAVWEFLLAQ